jgi:hypothetical protein
MRATRRAKAHRGGVNCPPGMPPRVCEKYKERMSRKRLDSNTQRNIRQAAYWHNFRKLPENERISRQKAYWNKYRSSRSSLKSNNKNNNINTINLHVFDETKNV